MLKVLLIVSVIFKPRPQLFQGAFFYPRDVRARYAELFCYFSLSERSAHRTVDIRNAVPFADYFAFAVGKLLAHKAVELFGVDLQLYIVFHIDPAAENIRKRQRVSVRVVFYGVVQVHLGELVLYLAEVHFYLVGYYTLAETLNEPLYAGSVAIIGTKYPADAVLCSSDFKKLTLGEQLRVLRLKAGLTIEQVARSVGVGRRCVMGYELGKVKHMKRDTVAKLLKLYKK